MTPAPFQLCPVTSNCQLFELHYSRLSCSWFAWLHFLHLLVMFSAVAVQWFSFLIHLFHRCFFLFFSLFIQLKVLQCWLTQMRKSMKVIGVMNSGWSCVRGEWLSPNSCICLFIIRHCFSLPLLYIFMQKEKLTFLAHTL